ncbi:response regulator [Limnochorda pilosa]|uniref:LuxR family transcriptional regulator n=1 Tax=Limnochorda pilosa TaxID=1555112 RepID=A0A0K2SG57_LIMPI|nr:response regulator transcription factor [Limnochorda pilosa]BAS26075.1 LuxR family transcriptional regulator [Limnochorda pilosa]
MRPVRVLIVDDQQMIREGISLILKSHPGIEVVGEAANGREALERVEASQPDVVLMDISMPELNGIDATVVLKRRFPQVKVLALTVHDAEGYILQLLRAGASGYIVKKAAGDELIEAIRCVCRGDYYLHPTVTRQVIEEYVRHMQEGTRGPEDLLTERERQIVQLAAEGYKNREIAERLNISLKTVETHRANIMQKLNISDRVELVRYAIRAGIIEP